jgi:hypothetical protein
MSPDQKILAEVKQARRTGSQNERDDHVLSRLNRLRDGNRQDRGWAMS